MQLFDSLRDFIKYSEPKELAKYLGIFAGVFCLLFGILFYFHYSRVSWYAGQLEQLNTWRKETQKILRDAKLVKAQQQQVDEIIAKDKNFLIGEAYQSVIRKAGIFGKDIVTSDATTGESLSGKNEVQITSHLKGLSMKEVTDLLVQIAQVPQLYVKDLTIKRTPGRPTVDIDITVATLEIPV